MNVLILSTIPGFTLNLVRTVALGGHNPFLVTDQNFRCDCLSRWSHPRLVIEHDQLISGNIEAIKLINNWILKNKIEVIIPADTNCTRMLSRQVKNILARVFPISTPEKIDYLYNKATLSEFLYINNLPTPKTQIFHNLEELAGINFEYPSVVKTTWGESSWGFQKVNDLAALSSAAEYLVKSNSMPFIVQEWISGYDVGLNVLSHQGSLRAWTIQQRIGKGMKFFENPKLLELGHQICQSSGYHGVANIDLRIDERTNEIKIIDFNPRFWGSLLFSTWLGVNFVTLGLELMENDILSEVFCQKIDNVPNLCLSFDQIYKYVTSGLPPVQTSNSDLINSWYFQLCDPLPELFDKLSIFLSGRSILASQQALLS